MRITEIEYGFTKNIGNYENQRLTYRAILEPWENPEESLAILCDRVAQELNLPDQWHDLKCKFAKQLVAMKALEAQLEAKKTELVKAEMAWDNFAKFLTGHGVDPITLSVENFYNTRIEHSPCIAVIDDEDDKDDEDDEDDGDPYLYGDEDDSDPYLYGGENDGDDDSHYADD